MSKVKYNQLLRSQPDDSLIIFFNLRLYHSNTAAVPPHDVVPPVQEHLQYSTVQYSTVQYSTVQYRNTSSTVQYSTVQYLQPPHVLRLHAVKEDAGDQASPKHFLTDNKSKCI